MTAGSRLGLWYESLSPLSTGFSTAPSLRGHNAVYFKTSPVSITLPVTTNAGDCIIMCVEGDLGASGPASGSGAGATWVTTSSNGATGTYNYLTHLVVGYNTSASQTTCSVTLPGSGTTQINIQTSVWSNCKTSGSPVHATAVNYGDSISSLSVGPLSYVANQLVIEAYGSPNGGNNGNTWSNSATNNSINDVGSNPRFTLNYIIPNSSGSTSLTSSNNNGPATEGLVLATIDPTH